MLLNEKDDLKRDKPKHPNQYTKFSVGITPFHKSYVHRENETLD